MSDDKYLRLMRAWCLQIKCPIPGVCDAEECRAAYERALNGATLCHLACENEQTLECWSQRLFEAMGSKPDKAVIKNTLRLLFMQLQAAKGE